MANEPDDDEGGKIRWSEGGNFAIVPEWLLYSDVSDKAIRLFAVLTRYADSQLRCMPARALLKDRLGCAASTVDSALRELKRAGAVTVEPYFRKDGGRGASNYVLHHVQQTPEIRSTPTGQPVTPLTGQSVRKELEPVLNESEELANARSSHERPTPKVKLDGRTNRPLNHLVERCGIDPGNKQRMRYAAAALNGSNGNQGIRDLFWLEVCRWADAHDRPDLIATLEQDGDAFNDMLIRQIDAKVALYRQTMDKMILTPSSLCKWWLDVELQRRLGPAGGMSGDDIRRKR